MIDEDGAAPDQMAIAHPAGDVGEEGSAAQELGITDISKRNQPEQKLEWFREIRDSLRWQCWEDDDGKKKPAANVNKPEDWLTLEEAKDKAVKANADGVGLLLGRLASCPDNEGVLVALDFDGVRKEVLSPGQDPSEAQVETSRWVLDLVREANSYCEVSPSGKGLKLIGWTDRAFAKQVLDLKRIEDCVIPDGIIGKQPQIEILSGRDEKVRTGEEEGSYFYTTVTFEKLPDAPDALNDITTVVKKVASMAAMGSLQASKSRNRTGANDQGHVGARQRTAAGRNDWLFKHGCSLRSQGMGEIAIRGALEATNAEANPDTHPGFAEGPLPDDELAGIVDRVLKYDPRERDFVRNQAGNIIPGHYDNIRLAIEQLGYTIRFNQFTLECEYRKDNMPHFEPLTESVISRFKVKCFDTFGFKPPYSEVQTLMNVDAEERYGHHPLREYLERLVWDKQPRLDTWLIDYASAEDGKYIRAVSRKTLLAAVTRVFHPGVKFDQCLVLIGDQGVGKSTLVKRLVPSSDFYSDNLPMDADAKEVIEQTRGKWIIEAPELFASGRKRTDNRKAMLSRTHDEAREAYARSTTRRARQFVIIATRNPGSFDSDETGQRRWWPVKVGGCDFDKLAQDRDQLWAEAMEAYRARESLEIDPGLYAEAAEHQEETYDRTKWDDLLEERLKEHTGWMLAIDMDKLIDPNNLKSAHETNIAKKPLRKLGWERYKQRVDGPPRSIWSNLKDPIDRHDGNRLKVETYREDDGVLQARVVSHRGAFDNGGSIPDDDIPF